MGIEDKPSIKKDIVKNLNGSYYQTLLNSIQMGGQLFTTTTNNNNPFFG